MLGDLSGVSKIYLVTGRTDMRKSFDGLMAIIRDKYELDPYANALYLFCGRDKRKSKHFTSIRMDLSYSRKDLMEVDVSNGLQMLERLDS